MFVEFLNILGRKVGHSAALAAASELTAPFLVVSEPATPLHAAALKKSGRFPSRSALPIAW